MKHWPPIAVTASGCALLMLAAALWGHDWTEALAWAGYFMLNLQNTRDYIRDAKYRETFE